MEQETGQKWGVTSWNKTIEFKPWPPVQGIASCGMWPKMGQLFPYNIHFLDSPLWDPLFLILKNSTYLCSKDRNMLQYCWGSDLEWHCSYGDFITLLFFFICHHHSHVHIQSFSLSLFILCLKYTRSIICHSHLLDPASHWSRAP